jgi:DNA-binding response OmpR family regulator
MESAATRDLLLGETLSEKEDSNDSQEQILLLFEGAGNQRQIRRELSNRYTVAGSQRASAWPEEVDLVLIDGPSLHQYRDALRALIKETRGYLPCLLVLSKRHSQPADERVFDVADEVVSRPLSPGALLGRVSALLRERSRALVSLNERKQQKQQAGQDAFSALDLRDRVATMLLFDQIVTTEQVSAAWRRWKKAGTPGALWRAVAQRPGVDREAIYARAAAVYEFGSVDFNMHSVRALVRKHRGRFTLEQWARMVDLNVAPVRTAYEKEKGVLRWTFASHDPGRSAVEHLLADLEVASHTLAYAPEQRIESVFADALPQLARDRAAQRLRSDLSEGRTPQEKDLHFFEELSVEERSSIPSSLRETLRRARERLEERRVEWPPSKKRLPASSGHGLSSEGKAGAVAPAAPSEGAAPLIPAEVFSGVLAEAVRLDARAVYLVGINGGGGRLAVYHGQGRTLRHRRTLGRFSAEAMVDFAVGQILSLRRADKRSESVIEHWAGGRRIDFRLSVAPPRALPEELPARRDAEAVVAKRVS